MENFVYEYPTKVYFGKGAARQHLSNILSAYGPNVLLAYGGGSIKKNGVYDEIAGILKENGKTITEFTGIMSNPTWEKVREGAKLARENKIDLVLAVGGGSVVDCCKVVCAQAVTNEDLWEVEMVRHGIPTGKPIPLGAVVTASGTGAEMNGGAVITNESAKIKGGMFAAAPRFAILDPDYTMTLPRMQVLSGAFDTLSHAAVLHPVYYRHIVKDAPEKFARMGQAVFGVKGAETAVETLATFIQECGLPTKLSQLHSKTEITPELLRQVADSVNLLPNGPRQLTHHEVYDILTECL